MTAPREGRCGAAALITEGPVRQWKRCIRRPGHDPVWEPHTWVEALNVVGRNPHLVTWYGDAPCESPTISDIHLRGPA